MKYIERLLARQATVNPENAPVTNRQNRQIQCLSVLSVPDPARSELSGDNKGPSEVERLITEFRTLFMQVNSLAGPELREAHGRISAIADRIRRKEPNFDWSSIWTREEPLPGDGTSGEWDPDTALRIEWLKGVKPEAILPFHMGVGWFVRDPKRYIEALRRDVTKGPSHRNAGQIGRDLETLTTVLGIDLRPLKRGR